MRVAQHAAVSETVGLARARAGAGSAQFVNAVLRKVSRSTLGEWLEAISSTRPTTSPVSRSPRAIRCGSPGRCARPWSGRDARPTTWLSSSRQTTPHPG
ncbi:transcription antitermination factor NusB [Oerskovia sp. M15]